MELEEYRRIAEAEDRHWWYQSMPALVEAMLGGRLRPGVRILDAGCGPGANFEFLSRFGEVVGIDYEPLAIELAHERHPRVESLVADITDLPFAAESFDLTIELTVLALVEKDAMALAELARVTRPGGAVLLLEPAIPRLRREHDVVQNAYRRYRLEGLTARVEAAGLRVARATYANSFLVPPAAAIAALGRLRSPRPEDATSDFERGYLDPLFARLAAAERRLLASRDLPVGLSAVIVAERPS